MVDSIISSIANSLVIKVEKIDASLEVVYRLIFKNERLAIYFR